VGFFVVVVFFFGFVGFFLLRAHGISEHSNCTGLYIDYYIPVSTIDFLPI